MGNGGRRDARLRALVLASLVAGTLSCAPSLAGEAAVPDTVVSAEARSTQARLDALVAMADGIRLGRLAGELIMFRRSQDPFIECMRGRGISFRPQRFIDPTVALPEPIVLHTEWLDPPSEDLGLPAQARALTEMNDADRRDEDRSTDAYLSLPPEKRKRWDAAVEGPCRMEDPGPQDPFPNGALTLLGDIEYLLTEVGEGLNGHRAGFVTCMESFGVAVGASRVDDIIDLYRRQREPPGSDEGDAETWKAWVTEVRTYAAADAYCRYEAYEAGMEALAPELERFEIDHADQIRRVAEGWDRMIERASAYPEWRALAADAR